MDTLSLTKEARIYNGEKTVSSINGAGKAREHCIKKIKLVHFLTQFNIGFLSYSIGLYFCFCAGENF